MDTRHPVQFSVEYPDRDLNRLTTFFRLITAIPIVIVFAGVSGGYGGTSGIAADGTNIAISTAGLLVIPPLLMILFRRKYPRWWFDWNRELMRFSARLVIYLSLMDDRYPSTDEQQSVTLDFPYPDAQRELRRGLPLVKWLLAIPHYVLLFFLYIASVLVVVAAWFVILFTGRFPRALFDYLVGVERWTNRVIGYAFVLVTDRYPPFTLSP
jgi:Domain of unknown function (DUF4389)